MLFVTIGKTIHIFKVTLSVRDLVDHWVSISTLSLQTKVRESVLLGVHNVFMGNVAVKLTLTARVLLRRWGGGIFLGFTCSYILTPLLVISVTRSRTLSCPQLHALDTSTLLWPGKGNPKPVLIVLKEELRTHRSYGCNVYQQQNFSLKLLICP